MGFGLIISWHVALAAQGLYVSHRLRPIGRELKEISRAILFSTLMLLVAANLGSWPTINVRTVTLFGLVSFTLIGGMRSVLRLNLRRLRRRGHNVKTLLIVGGGARGQRFFSQLNLRQDLGYRVIGYVDSDPAFARGEFDGAPWMGTVEQLPRILATEIIDEVA